MPSNQITPEKITHPLQLMAAWFVMLIALVGTLLTAAAKIERPPWVAGFLVISAVGLALLVMFAVFLMLTAFRPHLQGPREYAAWIKDERRFKGYAVEQITIGPSRRMELAGVSVESVRAGGDLRLPTSDDTSALTAVSKGRTDATSSRDMATYLVQIASLDKSDELITTLKSDGFTAEAYRPSAKGSWEEHAAVWIGVRVPPYVVVRAIKTALGIWPHLKYLHISSDNDNGAPDDIHDQIFFGGATSTAKKYRLLPWSIQQLQSLPDDLDAAGLQRLVRAKYS